MAGLRVPLSTLRRRPCDRQRMTRGRDGWLGLSRVTLAFTTPCRFVPAHCRSSARSRPPLARGGRKDEWHLDLEKNVTMDTLGGYPACPPQAKTEIYVPFVERTNAGCANHGDYSS